MLSPRQLDDLRSIRDRLHSGGGTVSRAFVRRLLRMNPRLEGLLPRSGPGSPPLLGRIFGHLLAAMERPDAHKEGIRQFGRRAAGRGITPQQFRVAAAGLSLGVAEHLGPAFTPQLQEACQEAVSEAAAWFHDGLFEAEAEGGSRSPSV